MWGIWFPDLSGCVSAAATAELTIEQAYEALALWVEDAAKSGAGLPRARTMDELTQDQEVAAALAKGDAAIVVRRCHRRYRPRRGRARGDAAGFRPASGP